jgi:hypothetical protein
MNALIHAHSGLRWIALFLIIYAIINAVKGKNAMVFVKRDRLINLFTMISFHTQLLIGFILYFMSGKVSFNPGWMKVAASRFYGMEHVLMMVAAVVVITIGRKKSEKSEIPSEKHGYIVKWFIIGLVLLLAGIPWPFRANLGGAWF